MVSPEPETVLRRSAPSQESLDNRSGLLEAVRHYAVMTFGRPGKFVPGKSEIPVSGKVFGADEVALAVEAALDGWWTTGRFATQFERQLAARVGVRNALLVNSGSSANLLAVTCLTAVELRDRRLVPGDEVVTAAAGFPTTVAPIVQNGLVPVFVDSVLGTYNVAADQVEAAIGPRTKAIILAHTLGNPFDLDHIRRVARDRGLWLIEDTCDALGSTYRGKPVGSFGDLATLSFYPAHHITTGEGGAVLANSGRIRLLVESLRDWGRDCWCQPGKSNTCGKRFDWQLGDLPHGYDHKYTYSRLGYNLKMTDFQAALGVAQLEKLDGFTAVRRHNFERLSAGLRPLDHYFILPVATPNAEPSWFGFPLSVRPGAPFRRSDCVAFLERRRISTRELFAGNITKQPAFRGVAHRKASNLKAADFIMDNTFWIGVFPGINDAMIDYVLESFHDFVRGRAG